MALTLLVQEPFQAVGTLTSGSPGSNFASVTGTWTKRAVGPRLSGDTTASSLGWSARIDTGVAAYGEISMTSGAGTSAKPAGMWGAWVYIDKWLPSGTGQSGLMTVFNALAQGSLTIRTRPDLGVIQYGGIGVTTTTYLTPTLRTWYWLAVEWSGWTASTASWKIWYMALGDANPTLAVTLSSIGANSTIGKVSISANSTSTPPPGFSGRIGMPSLYSCGSFGDGATYPTAIVRPTAGPFSWYVNPSTGVDTNDGTSSSAPWLTFTKLAEETAGCGIFGRLGLGAGDTVIVDTSGAPLDLGASRWQPSTIGITVKGNQPPPTLPGPVTLLTRSGGDVQNVWWEAKLWKDISGATWALEATTSHIYSTTDSAATDLASVVVWEDDKWMTHPKGAAFSNVKVTMDATPGSFYSDGTKVYVHPFGSTIPGADGKVYTRSRSRSALASAITFGFEDWTLKGLKAGKTALADKATDDPSVGYAVAIEGSYASGSGLMEDCYLYYASKHTVGNTDLATTRSYTIRRVQVEQGAPYSGQSLFVDYTGTQGDGTATTLYEWCVCNAPAGLIGSTAGSQFTIDGFTPCDVWFSHNTVSGSTPGVYAWTYATITIRNCYFNGVIGTAGSATSLQVLDTTFWGQGGALIAVVADIARCTILGSWPASAITPIGLICNYKDSLLIQTQALSGASGAGSSTRALSDIVTIDGCTLDCRAASVGTDPNACILVRQTACTLTLKNSVILMSNGGGLIQNAVNTDTITLSRNEYVLSSGILLRGYNDGATTVDRTPAQAATLGLDAGSILLATNPLTEDYRHAAAPPVVAVNAAPSGDLTGRTFGRRKTPGAYETPRKGRRRTAGRGRR